MRDPADPALPLRVCGWREGQRWLFHFFGFARYVFDPQSHSCSAQAFAGASDGQLIDTFQRAVLPFILQGAGTEVLHASAIDTQAGIIVFAAHSGTGKSTLAAAFEKLGFAVWADDAVAWRAAAGTVTSVPLPFRLRVGEHGARYVPLVRSAPGEQRPIAGVVILDRKPAGDAELTMLDSASKALAAALPHAFCFSTRSPLGNRRMIWNHLSLVEGVPVFQMRFTSDVAQVARNAELIRARLNLEPAHMPQAARNAA